MSNATPSLPNAPSAVDLLLLLNDGDECGCLKFAIRYALIPRTLDETEDAERFVAQHLTACLLSHDAGRRARDLGFQPGDDD